MFCFLIFVTQLASRKQFIEYKLKLATRTGADGGGLNSGVSAADRQALAAELVEVQSSSDALIRQYEKRFGESYLKMSVGDGAAGAGGSSVSAAAAPAGSAQAPVPSTPATPAARSSTSPGATLPSTSNATASTGGGTIRDSISYYDGGNSNNNRGSITGSNSNSTAAGKANTNLNKSAFKSVPAVK